MAWRRTSGFRESGSSLALGIVAPSDDTNVAGKRRRDFNRNKVIGLMKAALPRFVLYVQPVGTDHD